VPLRVRDRRRAARLPARLGLRAPHRAPLAIERGETAVPRTGQRNASFVVLAGGVLFAGALHQQHLAQGVLDAAQAGNITDARRVAYNEALVHRDRLRTGGLVACAAAGALALTGLALFVFDDPRPRAARVEIGPRSAFLIGSF